MSAFVCHSFGSADVLHQTTIDRPSPTPGEVLVRVRATSVNPYDWHILRGEPRIARLMGIGLRRPKQTILGADVAGEVAAVGAGVTAFKAGDEVYALVSGGGFAEYVCVPERDLVPKPRNLSFEEAAAVPLAACTALIAVRDAGRVQPGHSVLINGASGGVGTFAVQLARALGAEVTGVCGPRNVELVRSLGAGTVIDYSTEDFTRTRRRYDLMIDIAGGKRISAGRRILTAKGTYVVVGGPAGRWLQPAGHVFATLAVAPFVSQRMTNADLVRGKENPRNLRTLAGLIEDGSVRPVIDRRYSFDELPAAVAYQETGHCAGKVVVTV